MNTIANWFQRQLLEKALGRVIILALASLSGYLSAFVPANILQDWVSATQRLAEILLPLALAWLLGKIRFSRALNTPAPK